MKNELDTLYGLILDREVEWQRRTREIIQKCGFVATGIIAYLELPKEAITWDSLDVIGQEFYVQVTIPAFDRFRYVDPGEMLHQTLTIILPMSVVETEDADLITVYLQETEDIRKHDHRQPEDETGGIVALQTVTKRSVH